MIAIALPAPEIVRSEEHRRLAAWAMCWIVLPNIAFWLIWLVAAPPRLPEILVAGATGLVVRHQSWAIKMAAFFAVLVYSALSFVAGLFNLAIASLMASIQFMGEMNPTASVDYVIAGLCLVVTLVVAGRALRASTGFVDLRTTISALLLILAAATIDAWISHGGGGSYKRSAPNGASFGSAVTASGFAEPNGERRHQLLVVVEAMGLPVDHAMRERLFARWRRSDIMARYRVTTGATPYFGSTTNGEIRELCGRWGDYPELLERRDGRCLPARMRAAGYRTTALHGFDGDFFDRRRWYPQIGFDTMLFRGALVDKRVAHCAGVFPGACDRDIPRLLGDMLVKAKQPQFLYWLTLNTHLPVPDDASLRTTRCAPGELAQVAEHKMICRQFQLWDEMADRLAEQLTRSDLPAADILLVGDHMPPYFDRHQRSKFDPEQVPWILLQRR